jgi:hypothetical protein
MLLVNMFREKSFASHVQFLLPLGFSQLGGAQDVRSITA